MSKYQKIFIGALILGCIFFTGCDENAKVTDFVSDSGDAVRVKEVDLGGGHSEVSFSSVSRDQRQNEAIVRFVGQVICEALLDSGN